MNFVCYLTLCEICKWIQHPLLAQSVFLLNGGGCWRSGDRISTFHLNSERALRPPSRLFPCPLQRRPTKSGKINARAVLRINCQAISTSASAIKIKINCVHSYPLGRRGGRLLKAPPRGARKIAMKNYHRWKISPGSFLCSMRYCILDRCYMWHHWKMHCGWHLLLRKWTLEALWRILSPEAARLARWLWCWSGRKERRRPALIRQFTLAPSSFVF